MKYILILLLSITSYSIFAQTGAKFIVAKHDFGKIKQDNPAKFTFIFKNTGSKPLIVESATAECGCTTPEYPKEPIIKGKDGKIKVTFNAALSGPFKKNVTVKFANIAEPTVLSISGEVIPEKPIVLTKSKKSTKN